MINRIREKQLHIFYESNDYYAPMTGISIMSVLDNHKMDGIIHFTVVCDKVSEDNIDKLRNVVHAPHDIRFIDAEPYITDLEKLDSSMIYFGSYTTNLHIFVAHYFDENIDNCLFMDGDTLIIDDIEKVWDDISLEGKAAGLAVDCINQQYKKVIGIENHRNYYNTGFIYYDLKRWRKRECEKRMLNHIKGQKKNYPLADQDLYNVVIYDDIKKISIKYNLISSWLLYKYKYLKLIYGLNTIMIPQREYVDAVSHPVCYHFAGNTFGRPWFRYCIHPAIKDYLRLFYQSEWKDNTDWFKKEVPFIYSVWNFMYLYFPDSVFAIIAAISQRLYILYAYGIKKDK